MERDSGGARFHDWLRWPRAARAVAAGALMCRWSSQTMPAPHVPATFTTTAFGPTFGCLAPTPPALPWPGAVPEMLRGRLPQADPQPPRHAPPPALAPPAKRQRTADTSAAPAVLRLGPPVPKSALGTAGRTRTATRCTATGSAALDPGAGLATPTMVTAAAWQPRDSHENMTTDGRDTQSARPDGSTPDTYRRRTAPADTWRHPTSRIDDFATSTHDGPNDGRHPRTGPTSTEEDDDRSITSNTDLQHESTMMRLRTLMRTQAQSAASQLMECCLAHEGLAIVATEGMLPTLKCTVVGGINTQAVAAHYESSIPACLLTASLIRDWVAQRMADYHDRSPAELRIPLASSAHIAIDLTATINTMVAQFMDSEPPTSDWADSETAGTLTAATTEAPNTSSPPSTRTASPIAVRTCDSRPHDDTSECDPHGPPHPTSTNSSDPMAGASLLPLALSATPQATLERPAAETSSHTAASRIVRYSLPAIDYDMEMGGPFGGTIGDRLHWADMAEQEMAEEWIQYQTIEIEDNEDPEGAHEAQASPHSSEYPSHGSPSQERELLARFCTCPGSRCEPRDGFCHGA